MHGFLRLSLFFLCTHISILPMQLTRIVARTIHHVTHEPTYAHYCSTRLPYDPNQSKSPNDKSVTKITSPSTQVMHQNDMDRMPTDFAEHDVTCASEWEETISSKINCMTSDGVLCKCIKPYITNIPSSEEDGGRMQLYVQYRGFLDNIKQLKYIQDQFSNDKQISAKIAAMQQQLLCPSTSICYKNVGRASDKRPLLFATGAWVGSFAMWYLVSGPGSFVFAGILATITGAPYAYGVTKPDFKAVMACNAMMHYLKDKNKAINQFLDELKSMLHENTQKRAHDSDAYQTYTVTKKRKN